MSQGRGNAGAAASAGAGQPAATLHPSPGWPRHRAADAHLSPGLQAIRLRDEALGSRFCIVFLRKPEAAFRDEALFEMVAVALDVRRQTQPVVAHEALGALRVAGLERLDDLHVLLDRLRGTVALAQGRVADAAHVHQ